MIRLEQLPQVAEETLGGLTAPPRLARAASRPAAAPISRRGRALAMALSLVLTASLGTLALSHLAGQRIPEVTHLQAGDEHTLPEGARSAAYVPRVLYIKWA